MAVLGASGYTGAEVVRLSALHPHIKITALTGEKQAGKVGCCRRRRRHGPAAGPGAAAAHLDALGGTPAIMPHAERGPLPTHLPAQPPDTQRTRPAPPRRCSRTSSPTWWPPPTCPPW